MLAHSDAILELSFYSCSRHAYVVKLQGPLRLPIRKMCLSQKLVENPVMG